MSPEEDVLEINDIFPTAIGMMRNIFLTDDEIEFLKTKSLGPNDKNFSSEEQFLLNYENLTRIKRILQACLERYYQHVYMPFDGAKIKITQSWINLSKKGQGHHYHQHSNSFISGCLYVRANKDHHKIQFHKISPNQLLVAEIGVNKYNSHDWTFDVGAGDLIIFPSYIYHSVPNNTVDEDRVSLCFNSFIDGQFAPELSPLGLKLKV